MKSKWIFILLFLCTATSIFPVNNPWGNLKKIYFYDSIKDYGQVLENLAQINSEGMERNETQKLAQSLITFGDYYFDKKEYDNAIAFYQKVLSFSPRYWYLYNKLEKIDREKGSSFLGFKNVFRQLVMMLQNFNSSFLFVNSFFSMIFFSGLFVFFLFSIILFIKYFKLAGNDLLISGDGGIDFKKMILVIALVLWPLLILSGWMVYPFLITGFLWAYLNDNEKKAISYFFILIGIFTFLYSFNLMMEKSAVNENFKTIQQVYNGHLFQRDEYEKFDNDLKVAQALSYYQNKEYDTALDILTSTGEEYKNKLKYDLIGNIYYKSNDFSESINPYIEALSLDDTDDTTLTNFTLTLLRNSDEELFKTFAKRYPEIDHYKQKVSALKEVKISRTAFLWKRLLSFSSDTFKIGTFIKRIVAEFLKLPIIYFIVIIVLYIFGIKKLSPVLGGSTYCSKCSKIIKEASVHKSYKLCDECYQLFLIKDVIFLEAKILKEKELNKKFKKKYSLGLLFSILIPGLNLTYKERNRLFILLASLFYFLLGFSVIGTLSFSEVFLTAPIILNLIGMLSLVVYFVINILSVLGDYDGF